MEQLIQYRATGGTAYELRNGTRVEYAATFDGQCKRMRALGCPEAVLQRAMQRKAARAGQLTDAERHRKATTLGAKITADADADRSRRASAQAKQIAADSEQERKDKELARRMANAAGRVSR